MKIWGVESVVVIVLEMGSTFGGKKRIFYRAKKVQAVVSEKQLNQFLKGPGERATKKTQNLMGSGGERSSFSCTFFSSSHLAFPPLSTLLRQ